MVRPAILKLRSMGEYDQKRKVFYPIDHQIEHLQRCGIGPVCILEQQHAGLFARSGFGEIDQRAQCFVLRVNERNKRLTSKAWRGLGIMDLLSSRINVTAVVYELIDFPFGSSQSNPNGSASA